LTGLVDHPVWQTAVPVTIDQSSRDGAVRSELATPVRALWSERFLYLAFECPFTSLTTFNPALTTGERYNLETPGVSLWDRDVVEAFIAPDESNLNRYMEFEVAPTNERLDLLIAGPDEKDFGWESHFTSAISIDKNTRTWRCEVKIPLEAFAGPSPVNGTRWRLNLFRCDRANRAYLAYNPTLKGTFHVPERFGVLEFID
jgi:hypothetical protein